MVNDQENERIVWEGHPSLLLGIRTWVACGILIIMGFAIPMNLGKAWGIFFACLFLALLLGMLEYLSIISIHYEITNQRLKIRTGIFSRTHNETEMYRIKDIKLDEPFLYRLFGLGKIILYTSDKTSEVILLSGLNNADQIKEQIRVCVDIERKTKKVTEIDMR